MGIYSMYAVSAKVLPYGSLEAKQNEILVLALYGKKAAGQLDELKPVRQNQHLKQVSVN
ncbi:MAG: hypothetical protein R2807_05145 [Chitinophagales bacterium]